MSLHSSHSTVFHDATSGDSDESSSPTSRSAADSSGDADAAAEELEISNVVDSHTLLLGGDEGEEIAEDEKEGERLIDLSEEKQPEQEDDNIVPQKGTSLGAGRYPQPTEIKSLISGEMLEVSHSSSEQYSEETSSRRHGANSSSLTTPRASNRRRDAERTVRITAAHGDRLSPEDDDNSSTGSVPEDWDMRHLQNVLGFNYSSRRRIRAEGMESLGDLYDIEDLLREGKVQGLRSIETARLIQFLDWVKVYQKRADGCLPDIERHFSRHEYEAFLGSQRTKSYSHVWPFLVHDLELRILELPITYSLSASAEAAAPRADATEPDTASPTSFDLSGLSAIHASGALDDLLEDPEESAFSSSARIRDNFLVAEEAHSQFRLESQQSRRDLKKCMDKYRLVVDDTAATVEDCMLQAFACVKLALLLQRVEFKNEKESLDLLERATEQYKVPTAMFLFGYALAVGKGPTVQDVPRGISLLNSAASAGIGEAYFVLGNLHEGNVEGIKIDLNSARQYYEAASNSFQSSPRRAWMGMFVGVKTSSASSPARETEGHWNAELAASRGLVVSNGGCNAMGILCQSPMVGALVYWGMLAQAFLVGAAAFLTQRSQTEHYSGLLPAVPLLGILLSSLSIVQAMALIWSNRATRVFVGEMLQAKLKAFQTMLKVQLYCPPLHYLLLWHCYCSRWFLLRAGGTSNRSRKQLEALDAQILWVEAWGYTSLTLLWSRLVDMLVLLFGCAFLATWIALFVQEAQSHVADCSHWSENTCQGSMVRCNEEEQKVSTCFYLGADSSSSST